MADQPARVALVTGGGAGLGRVMVLALLEAGHRVVAMGRTAEPLDALAAEAERAGYGDRFAPAVGDVTQPEDCRRAVETAADRFGAIDALINNAGIALPTHLPEEKWSFDDISVEFWRRLMDVNVNGPFFMAKAVAPFFRDKPWGRIVNHVTSLRSMIRAGETPYGPSKAALEAMTAAWADEYAGSGITVNAILPGRAADTGMILASAIPDRSALLPPQAMAAPIRWLISTASDGFTGMRVVASEWDAARSDEENVRLATEPAGWKPLLATMVGANRVWPPK